jgi:hypothetical protein
MQRTAIVVAAVVFLALFAGASEVYKCNVVRLTSRTVSVECDHQRVPSVRLVNQERIGGTRTAVEVTCSQ